MSHLTLTQTLIRQRLFVRGVVQGVGFRPFVYGLALQHQLTGHVGNNSEGVFIEVEGVPDAITAFVKNLRENPPQLAHIDSIEIADLETQFDEQFRIIQSQTITNANTLISPDLCICEDCLRELNEPSDRRYRYPFINCTNCGPRFTIIKDVPYDRPLTTMADFPMCAACESEYDDPLNRRFHAQPNACPDCGPQVTYISGDDNLSGDAAIQQTIKALQTGQIVAIKGIGGFHLACDATQDDAVQRLRRRKGRQDKPFAIMVSDLEMAREIAIISDAEAKLLTSHVDDKKGEVVA